MNGCIKKKKISILSSPLLSSEIDAPRVLLSSCFSYETIKFVYKRFVLVNEYIYIYVYVALEIEANNSGKG